MLAAYVMHYAKAASIYCGKHTDMFLVRGGRIQILRRQQTQRLEQLMEEYQRHLEPAAFRNAIEQPLTTEQSHAGFIAAAQIRQAIADLRATWDATYPTSPTSSSSDQT